MTLSPDLSALVDSDPLRRIICNDIDHHGPMTFARYMEMALYHPALGYYRSPTPKFGMPGDFITAPISSPLFSRCLARYCIPLFKKTESIVLEIGAGSGALLVDFLLELERLKSLPERYYILELSGYLRGCQRALIETRIPHLLDRIEWLQQWPVSPVSGVVIANELFDAMPVHRFVIRDSIQEYYVTHDKGQLQWHVGSPSSALLVEQLTGYDIEFPEGYSSEINLLITPWMHSLSSALKTSHLIFIDYGYKREAYYHPERSMGTLMCHFRHRAHDNPLIYPGIQDITAHVDFTLVAEAAIKSGFELASFKTQAQFLMDAGITELLSEETDLNRQIAYASQVKQLLLPGQMGEAFKVIEFYHS